MPRLLQKQERLVVLSKDLTTIANARSVGLRVEDLSARHLGDLHELNRTRGQLASDRRFARYLEQGFSGFIGYCDDHVAGYYWWVDREGAPRFPDLRKMGLGISLGEKDVYGSDFYVLDERRGGGIAAAFLLHVETRLRDRGYERIWGYVVSDNRPARWTYSTRGYEPMWVVMRRRVGPFWRATREPL